MEGGTTEIEGGKGTRKKEELLFFPATAFSQVFRAKNGEGKGTRGKGTLGTKN